MATSSLMDKIIESISEIFNPKLAEKQTEQCFKDYDQTMSESKKILESPSDSCKTMKDKISVSLINKNTSTHLSIFVIGVILVAIIAIISLLIKGRRVDSSVESPIPGNNLEGFTEHLDGENNVSNDNLFKMVQKLQAQVQGLQGNKIFNIKNVKNTPPAFQTSGTHYATGPLINKQFNDKTLSMYANGKDAANSNGSASSPYFGDIHNFLGKDQTWTYEIDGTIRSNWEKTGTGMGACLAADNKNVLLTNNNNNCSKWTYDTFGRLIQRVTGTTTGGHGKCLVPVKIVGSKKLTVGLEECPDDNIEHKQIWSFNGISNPAPKK